MATNMMKIFLSFVLVIAVFSGIFLFYASEVSHSTIPMTASMNTTYNDMNEQLGEINATTSECD